MPARLSPVKWVLVLVIALLLLVPAANAQQRTYTVQPGDTLRAIAAAFNVDLNALIQLNGIVDPNRVNVGMVLMIPDPAGTSTASTRTYTVQPGEGLQNIAQRFAVPLEALIAANNLTATSTIFVGQILNIPAVAAPADTAAIPIFTQPPVVEHPVVQQPFVQNFNRVHIVRPGDTLSQIALNYGVTMQRIIDLNGIANPRIIFVGQALIIPPATAPVFIPPPAPVFRPGHYIVQPGDTMLGISRLLGVDVFNIARANGIFNLNRIFAGQALIIP